VLGEAVTTHHARLYLFCLMPNHFHLVVETPRANLDRFMHGLLTRYTVYFNRRHGRHGHLMQGRYGAKLVEDGGTANRYLLALSRYVHLNPAFTDAARLLPLEERIALVRAYRWSSYGGYVRWSPRCPWLAYAPILAQVGGDADGREEAYRRFVETGLAETDEEFRAAMRLSARSIGGDKFREWVEEEHRAQAKSSGSEEDVAFRRTQQRTKPVAEVLDAAARFCGVAPSTLTQRQRGSKARGIAARWLCRFAGLTQRQAAETLGLRTGAAVSFQTRNLAARIEADPDLKARIEAAEAALSHETP
jgi:hypothetical protein